MTFAEIIEQLCDGKRYEFTHPHLNGYFHKAPYPAQEEDTSLDGADCAITFWNETGTARSTPYLMPYDFDEDYWDIKEVPCRRPIVIVD